MVRQYLVGAAFLLCATTATAGDTADDLARAYDLAYNLDHEAAVELFEATIAADPNNPATHRGLAAMTWMRVLFLRGTMTVADYLGGVTPKNVDLPEPPAELAATFDEHATRAVALSEAMVKATPDNADAYYQLGASLGLAASYRATSTAKCLTRSSRPRPRTTLTNGSSSSTRRGRTPCSSWVPTGTWCLRCRFRSG